ncbi:hypothetical protein NBRC3257_2323 [Gluconobacter thailandicus NBRC 3257]|uniref:Uncharacterized protein n=1 Tax=Gluconobacter thailandicus NBRC 3257 TaxID=1381097 RepID=A0ABQ0IYN7_GLUTH|nr:hypothetical protein NBRC3255_0816 [Gluconobacter thailandicus NBRC 3255]GAD27324.1 hypothetical protein NBRC3257_2323 [Gluconobacter thailandicus NBRC 3257]
MDGQLEILSQTVTFWGFSGEVKEVSGAFERRQKQPSSYRPLFLMYKI